MNLSIPSNEPHFVLIAHIVILVVPIATDTTWKSLVLEADALFWLSSGPDGVDPALCSILR